ncbi:MAG: CBS domain-containing protein [Myxococcales bacterium]|jgi:CBS domain-containing protein
MDAKVRDYMQSTVVTVEAGDKLADVERLLIEKQIGGAPVLDDGKVVGVISRSDLVKQLVVEQSLSEMVSDYYRDPGLAQPESSSDVVTDNERLRDQDVRDVMATRLIAVGPEDGVGAAARVMREQHVHRVLVTERGELAGIVTAHDLLRTLTGE